MAPEVGESSWILLDVASREAGVTLEIDGEDRVSRLPVGVGRDADVVLRGLQDWVDVALEPGILFHIRGAGAHIETWSMGDEVADGAVAVVSGEAAAWSLAESVDGEVVETRGDVPGAVWQLTATDLFPTLSAHPDVAGLIEVLPISEYALPGTAAAVGEVNDPNLQLRRYLLDGVGAGPAPNLEGRRDAAIRRSAFSLGPVLDVGVTPPSPAPEVDAFALIGVYPLGEAFLVLDAFGGFRLCAPTLRQCEEGVYSVSGRTITLADRELTLEHKQTVWIGGVPRMEESR